MANQYTNAQGQPLSGFTPQEEQVGAAFGLDPTWGAETYQATAPTFAPPAPYSRWLSPWARASEAGGLGVTDSGQRKVVDAFVDLTNMGQDQLTSLQHRLYDAGFYDASYYDKKKGPQIHWGDLDTATVQAYSASIRETMRYAGKKSFDDVLNEGAQHGYGQANEQRATPRKPLVITLTPAESLLPTADAVAEKVLGRKLTDSELRHFVDSFHSMQAEDQRAKYNAGYDPATGQAFLDPTTGEQVSGPDATISAGMKPEEFALSQLESEHPQDVRNVQMEHGYDVVDQLLHSRSGA